ncbi:2-aminoadipate transaminase [Paucidesulfovibrio gracilis DSM 16080]|uniref:2-aminoadipate transaminase n=1 Tax=Paucidesulfovibrio gracilis DSM 16080 TaxID=1121449 RepID=A0A1T4X673_9BACT|nr:PLP-dependent aminotransferase family protein [Paucidesulfovibrio gracilis]SKA84371.1 2-aminoadipate transaminase [Paucidesulfovibrio gracilis DSM 16080]
MQETFAKRMGKVHRSFIREILKVTADPSIISFAGGLPNPECFPSKAIAEAAQRALTNAPVSALQYAPTEGDPELRAWIAERYDQRMGLKLDPDDILITTGSQQCVDMVAKVFLDQGDTVVLERPAYLGAIQSFSVFEPQFRTIPLLEDGPDLDALEALLDEAPAKLFYAVPNFQNPSGLSYSLEKRRAVAELCLRRGLLFVEDDPYGELRFKGEHLPSVYTFAEGQSILMGSFSKIATPGFRLGWIVARGDVRDALIRVKQASDLHTPSLTQRIMVELLQHFDMDAHIAMIRERYGHQRNVMVEAIREHFPEGVTISEPEGGMFLWVTLPQGCSSMQLMDKAVACKVAFVPGKPFYVDPGEGENTLRLNFSNASEEMIREGVARLGKALQEFLQ